MEDAAVFDLCVLVPFVYLPKLIRSLPRVTAEDVGDALPPTDISITADDDKGEFF